MKLKHEVKAQIIREKVLTLIRGNGTFPSRLNRVIVSYTVGLQLSGESFCIFPIKPTRKGRTHLMKFGDKVRTLRLQKKMTQEELSKALGISPRTISAYENYENHPRHRDVYTKLANFFEVETNYLLTEDEEFITEASEKYGQRGARQARELLVQASALFAGGELSENDQLAFIHEIQQLYLDSKELAKKKFSPKRSGYPR